MSESIKTTEEAPNVSSKVLNETPSPFQGGTALPTIPTMVASSKHPLQAATKPANYFEMWGLSEDKAVLIMATEDYAVWLDERRSLDWRTTPQLDCEINQKVKAEEINTVLNQVAVLKSYPVEHLEPKVRENFHTMIGEGLARAFECDTKSALQMLAKAGEYGMVRNQEVARYWYLCATSLTALFASLAVVLAFIFKDILVAMFGQNEFYFFVASGTGALGALVSILTRVGASTLDPSAGWKLHCIEGVGRIVIGIMGAGIVQLAMKVGLVMSMFNEKGHAALFLVALVAGASERMIPTIIKQVELGVLPKEGPNT